MIMRACLIFSFFIFCTLYAACQENQNNNSLSQEEYQAKFISDKHIHIKGTNFYIIPPDSFVLAASFLGFVEKSSGANIVINKTQSSYLNSVELYSSPQTLKYAGWKSEKIKIKRKEAFFMSSENSTFASMVEWILICERETGCYILRGKYPSSDSQKYSPQIKDSILSIVIQ
jgi:hypothetical protein